MSSDDSDQRREGRDRRGLPAREPQPPARVPRRAHAGRRRAGAGGGRDPALAHAGPRRGKQPHGRPGPGDRVPPGCCPRTCPPTPSRPTTPSAGSRPTSSWRPSTARASGCRTGPGAPSMLNFWASWCAPCRREVPVLIRLQDQYRDDGLVVVGVNIEEGALAGPRTSRPSSGSTSRCRWTSTAA